MSNKTHHDILDLIVNERIRQEELRIKGKFHWTCAELRHVVKKHCDPDALVDAARLAVLAEEFGEVSRHITESLIDYKRYQPQELKKELIQVAAVALAWCEAIESEDL